MRLTRVEECSLVFSRVDEGWRDIRVLRVLRGTSHSRHHESFEISCRSGPRRVLHRGIEASSPQNSVPRLLCNTFPSLPTPREEFVRLSTGKLPVNFSATATGDQLIDVRLQYSAIRPESCCKQGPSDRLCAIFGHHSDK
jgi:hypothetical protein